MGAQLCLSRLEYLINLFVVEIGSLRVLEILAKELGRGMQIFCLVLIEQGETQRYLLGRGDPSSFGEIQVLKSTDRKGKTNYATDNTKERKGEKVGCQIVGIQRRNVKVAVLQKFERREERIKYKHRKRYRARTVQVVVQGRSARKGAMDVGSG